jgi:hypothetical protein
MSAKPSQAGRSGRSYPALQRALLDSLLATTREQRRHLISGDVRVLSEVNKRLQDLLERQADLRRKFPPSSEWLESPQLEEVRRLARQLQEESRTNYVLACRGLQFADFSLAVIERDREGANSADPRGEAKRPQLLDTQT